MAKRELRFAVVIYGGASLAVYMHGVTKELLKLVRASKVLHEVGVDQATKTSYAEGPDQRPHDTEAIYYELLKQINKRNKFRVVIDVIAGASAGAINGIMLSKALVDDAGLDAHTDLWLGRADTDSLSGEKFSKVRKWYLYPFLKILGYWLPDSLTRDPENQAKLNRLARQSWFRPPFSGARVCHWFLEALDTMSKSRRPNSSLLPHDQRLDVYASVTDLAGYRRDMELHNAVIARENEHGLYCRFTHVQTEAGREQSDLSDDNAPGLVWAARASSSYAGAFAPFQHSEMQTVLRERGQAWPQEHNFLQTNLFSSDGAPAAASFDPRQRFYVDGGIVNNKPFEAVLEALKHRSADRQVRRVIVYVEPDPKVETEVVGDRALSYLNTIRAAASTIPRNQPVVDDLKQFVAQDKRVRNNRRVIDSNRARINTLVSQLGPDGDGESFTLEALRQMRLKFAGVADKEMGVGYRAYIQRRAWRMSDALAEEWALLTPELDSSEQQLAMQQTLQHWWTVHDPLQQHINQEDFLARFDVSFRIRGILFLIRRLNYHDIQGDLDEAAEANLADFKIAAYAQLENLYQLRRARGIDTKLAMRLIEAARQVPLLPKPAAALMTDLADALDLPKEDHAFDEMFFRFCRTLHPISLRQTILAEYVGFPLYDALLMTPGSEEGGPDPLTPVRVQRISPPDARTLQSIFTGLKCRELMGFLGFFNRGYREHDYLWGRLNAADRIVDFLMDAVAQERGDAAGAGTNERTAHTSSNAEVHTRYDLDDTDVDHRASEHPFHTYRLDLFERILQRERSRLHNCTETLAEIGEALREMRR